MTNKLQCISIQRKGDVLFVLPSQGIFPVIFFNETVNLSCLISVLKNIMQNINRAGQKRGLQWEYSESYHSENITVSPCYHAVEG